MVNSASLRIVLAALSFAVMEQETFAQPLVSYLLSGVAPQRSSGWRPQGNNPTREGLRPTTRS
jgi:hypothetical protein